MKTMSQQAAAAQQIRAILKDKYPNVRFTVRSSSFSMGDNINVGWTDGPTREKVDSLICQYQYGHFNGMDDLYENTNSRDDIPQTKYLFCNRSMSNEVYRELVAFVNDKWGYHLELTTDPRFGQLYINPATDEHTGTGWASHSVHQEFVKRSY